MPKSLIFCLILVSTLLQAAKATDLNVSTGIKGDIRLKFTLTSDCLAIEEDPPDETPPVAKSPQESKHKRALTAISCSPGQYDNSGTCTTCGTMCAYCEDSTGNCLGCQSNYTMKISSNKKNCECKDPSATATTCTCPVTAPWFDGSICQNCPTSGEYYKNTECIACSNTAHVRVRSFLKSKPSPSCCSDGKYLDTPSQKCNACSTNCELCDDGTGNCDKCAQKLYVRADVKVKKTSCCNDDGKYYNNGDKKCEACSDINCKSCEDSGTGETCLQCKSIIKKSTIVNIKKTTCCGEGKYITSGTTCLNCPDKNCKYCSDTGDGSTCLDCYKTITFTTTLNIKKTTCCQDGEYIVTGKSACSSCADKNCKVCADSGYGNTCLQCQEIVTMTPKLRAKKTSCCSDGYYIANAGDTCAKCQDNNCKTCADSGVGETCLQCSNIIKKTTTVGIKKTSCCNSGQFVAKAGDSCKDCADTNCNYCADSGIGETCLQCDNVIKFNTQLKIKKTTCCGEGKYITSGTTCKDCPDKNCKYCEDSGSGDTCLECQNIITMEAKLNIKKTTCCPDGKFVSKDQASCANCKDDNCKICEDSGKGEICLQCKEVVKFKNTLRIKKTTCCDDGNYITTGLSTCAPCKDENCSLCEDSGTGTNCLQCNDAVIAKKVPVKLKKTSCCGSGNYISTAGSSCTPCKDKNCDLCQDTGDGSTCLQCYNTINFSNRLNLKKTTCCSDGKFVSSSHTSCIACKDANCKICEDSNDGSNCLQCAEKVKFKDTLKLKKTSCCDDGKFVSKDQASCANCDDPNCSLCEDSGTGTNCLQCNNALIAKKAILKLKKTSCCDDGKYISQAGGSCAACKDTNCNLCQDSGDGSTCLQCNNDIVIKKIPVKLKKTTCCSDGQFVSNSQHTCANCKDDKCKICEDSGDGSSCLQCSNTIAFTNRLNLKKTTCCPDGKFVSSSHTSCINCKDVNCKICEDSNDGSNCLQCAEKVKLKDTLKVKKTSCCDEGKYYSSSQNSCVNCADTNCNLCEDSGAGTSCLQCNSALIAKKAIVKLKKTSCCADGKYIANAGDSCSPCKDTNCDLCEDSGTGTNCLQCNNDIIIKKATINLKKTSCCGDGQFVSNSQHACANCKDNKCKICEDTGDGSSCLKCSNTISFSNKLNLKKTTCCPDGKFVSSSQTTCANCKDDNCKICEDSGKGDACLQCAEKVKFKDTLKVKKTSCCDEGKYFSSTQNSCINCADTNCNLCEDSGTGTNCLQCNDALIAKKAIVKIKKTSCCEDGKYIANAGATCASCKDTNCNLCQDSGDGSTCLQCNNDIIAKKATINLKKTSCCGDGQFISNSQHTCANCKDDKCKICEDTGDGSSCLQCSNTIAFKNRLNLKKTTCCSDGNFISSSHPTCVPCKDTNCKICEDSNDGSNCLQCAEKIKLKDTLKVKKTSCCDVGKYYSDTQHSCVNCDDPNCSLCEDSGTGTNCLQCNNALISKKAILKLKKTSCCEDGSYISKAGDTCAACKDKNCDLCEDSGDGSTCLKCSGDIIGKNTLRLKKTTCCKDGEYISQAGGSCAACHDTNCKICEDSGNGSSCLQCAEVVKFKNTLKLKKTTCCPDGKFVSSSQSSCAPCHDDNCEVCEDSNDGSNCLKCAEVVKFKNTLKLKKTSCCDDGKYYSDTQHACISCHDPNCSLCEDSGDGSNCLQCSDLLSFKSATVKIKKTSCCDDGKFVSSIHPSCISCKDANCNMCEDSGDGETCLQCAEEIKFKSTLNIKKTTCCTDTTYRNGDKCDPCPDICKACEDVSGICITCSDKLKMAYIVPHPSSCCADGTYYKDGACGSCDITCELCNKRTGECTKCVDTVKMEADGDDNTKCKCKGDQKLEGKVCSCEPNYAFNGQVCSICGHFCSDCSDPDHCTTCIDKTRMKINPDKLAECMCKGTTQNDNGAACVCKTLDTYFDGADCSSCGENCVVCADDGSCTTCNNKLAITGSLTDPALCCGEGTFYDKVTNTCAACKDKCAKCDAHTGECTSCNDSNTMVVDASDKTKCVCNPLLIWDGSICKCEDAKAKWNGTKCVLCGHFCADCNSDGTVCNTCIDTTRMEVNTATPDQCHCKGSNQQENGDTCVCKTIDTYFKDTDCVSCGVNCLVCDASGGCTTCNDKIKVAGDLAHPASCCAAGTYYKEWSCISCDKTCGTCDKYTGECTTCIDTEKMEKDSSNIQKCKCIGDQTLKDEIICTCPDNSAFNGQKCSQCGHFCADCSDPDHCTACINSTRMIINTLKPAECTCKGSNQKEVASGCICNTQDTYFSETDCISCGENCAVCADDGSCTTCNNKLALTGSLTDPALCCGEGTFFDKVTSTCAACKDNCAKCDIHTGECTTCKDSNTMVVDAADKTKCVCNPLLIWDGSICKCEDAKAKWNGTKCVLCGHFCADCNLDGTLCNTCIDASRMEVNPATLDQCQCKGSNQQESGDSCICKTLDTYFKDTDCVSCGENCLVCDASGGCTTCKKDLVITGEIVNPASCCNSSQYYDGAKCQSCGTHCTSCSDATHCTTCADISMTKNADGSCSCPLGKYFLSDSCVSCKDKCAECSDDTGKCTKCIDTEKMAIDTTDNTICKCIGDQTFADGKCTCATGEFNGLVCSKCGNFCATCTELDLACTSCIDTNKMMINGKECVCKGSNQVKTSTTCTCSSGSYYSDSVSDCSTCTGTMCSSCDDYTENCNACINTSTMEFDITNPKSCKCKGTLTYQLSTNTCGCSPGYIDGTTCQSCGDHCAACDSTGCNTCEADSHLIVDPSNKKNCICQLTYHWITDTDGSSCKQCAAGTYYDGSKCTSCSTNCQSCDDLTGKCNLCVDSQKMKFDVDNTKCICIGSQNPSGNSCSCDSGKYFDGTDCTSCSDLCSTCADLTGECQSCKQQDLMIVDDTNKKNCKCISADLSVVSNQCVCSAGKQWNGSSCLSCGTFCSDCIVADNKCNSCIDSSRMEIVDGTLTCKCKESLQPTATGCVCSQGSYYNSQLCTSCGDLCDVCEDLTGVCTTCKDSNKMEVDSTNTKNCKCKGTQNYDTTQKVCLCAAGYFFDDSTCTACTNLCADCDTNKCITCKDIAHLIVNPSSPKDCICDSGYNLITATNTCEQCLAGTYYDGNKCASCSESCETCMDTTGFCTTCKNTSRMIVDPINQQNCICIGNQKVSGSSCYCDSGYYFDNSNCVKCSDLCSKCSDGAGECQTCIDNKMMVDPDHKENCICIGDQILDGNKCICSGTKVFNGAACTDCGTFCSSCDVPSNKCNSCINTDRMSPVANTLTCACIGNQQTTTTGCTCASEAYFDGSNCVNCGDLCTACDDNTGKCNKCKNTDTMEADPNDQKACKCKGNQQKNNDVCSCDTSQYFDGSNCATCSDLCTSCDDTGKCNGCISTITMEIDPNNQKTCRCKGTQVYDSSAKTCSCVTGYFDSTTCKPCGSYCLTCDSTKCLTCQAIDHLIFDTANPKNCHCETGYNWITATNTCEQCSAGTYYDGNKCASCSENCANCSDDTGFCSACKDNLRMMVDPSNEQNCICIGNQKVSGSTCYCDSGYYFDNSNCVKCSELCSKCSDITGECQTCIDNKMMVDPDHKKNCICIGDQTLDGNSCVCDGTKIFNGAVCSGCGPLCSTCTSTDCTACLDPDRMSPVINTLTCQCNPGQIQNTGSCSCDSGKYFDSITCSSCHSLCASCDDLTANCNACKQPIRMEVDTLDKTTCKCKENQQLDAGTSTCISNPGYFFDGTNIVKCGDLCATCEENTGICKTCIDSDRMELSGNTCKCKGNQQASSTSCTCLPNYIFDGTNCKTCGENCKTCKETGECTECNSNYVFEIATPPVKCTCLGKSYDNASGCSPCGNMCASCSNGGVCSACDDNNVQEIDTGNNMNCKCKAMNYYDGSSCQSCGTQCYTCDATKCTQCLDPPNMNLNTLNAHNCECKLGMYYDASSVTCQTCMDHCNICSTSSNCDSCASSYYFDGTICQLSNCLANQYQDGSSCKNCVAPCSTCSNSAFCRSCIAAEFVLDSKAGTCSCPSGKYYDSVSTTCKSCGEYCSTCSGTADFCLTCIDSTMDLNAGKCTCKDTNYFNDGKCLSCADPCLNCNGPAFCLSCIDATMTYTAATGVCKCKDGFYFDSITHSCLACDSTCATCSTSSSCLICKDTTMTISAGICTCPTRQYFDLTALSCKNCDATCGKCTGASSSSCTSCRDISMTLNDGACTCNSTSYFNMDTFTCHNCIGPCKSCASDTFCNSCIDNTASLTENTGVCTCPLGTYYNSTLIKCATCPGVCKTCSSYSTCTSCVANTNDLSNGACTCLSGYYASDKTCSMCPSPCSTCTSSTTCTACKKHATLSSSSKKCSCDRGYGLNTTDTSGYCVATCNKLCTVCDIDNANTCSSCVTNAELAGTTCACTANSAYSSATGGCACNVGYTLSNSKCVTCKKYLASSDIASAEFSSSWTSVSVKFNTMVDTSVDPSCSKTFTASTVALFGTGAVCSWTDKKTLKIALGTSFSLRDSTLYLDGTYILKDSNDPCTTNYQTLSVAPTASTSPVPTAVIIGISSFTLGCGSDPLSFSSEKSTGALGGNLTYAWSVSSISPANSKVSDAINGKTTSSLSLDRSLFSSSTTTTLIIKLTITNFLTISNSASFTTTISGESALTVIFDQGNTVSMKSSNSKTLKAKVTSLCSSTTGTVTWAWAYDSGPIIDSAAILANAKDDKLTINANLLTANSTPYVFKVTATQTSNGATTTGSATISVTVNASPLSIGLSKPSGDVSPDRDYTINAQNSKDPDDSNSSYKDFTYKWACVNSLDNTACIGADGKTPLSGDTDSTLTILKSQMVKGAQWDLTCTISKDTRTASATISLSILTQASEISIEIEYKVQKVSKSSNVLITAQVTAASTATLQWSENSGALSISPNYLSTMSVPSGQLVAGATYTFSFTVSYNGVNLKVEYPVNINLGAACTGSVTSDPTTGKSLTDKFKLSIDGCYDKDEEDYPLSYTYLDYVDSKAYTLGYTTEINSLSTYLLPGVNSITIRVCDAMTTCSDYKKDVSVGSYGARLLEDSNLMESYLANTVDVDNVPSSITLFCGSATIDSELFTKMWTDLQNYVASNTVDNDILQNALGASLSMTTQTEQMSAAMFQTFAEWLSKITIDNPDLVPNQDNMNTIVALADNYLAYGNLTEFSELSLEGYILNIDKFISFWEIAATKDDLVTQGAMDGTQNTETTKVYKYRDFPTAMANKTVPFSSDRVISMPTQFSYSDIDVMNMKLHYYNTSNDHSDLVMLSFAQSGTYDNYVLETTNETVVPFTTTDYPVILEMPISQNITEGNEWICLFLNETDKTWIHDGCAITEVKNTSVVFEVYHFSMFKLGQTSGPSPPEPYPQLSEDSCGDNYAPLYILVVTLFISMILAPIMVIYDRLEKIDVKKTSQNIHSPTPTERSLMSPNTGFLESEPRSHRHFFSPSLPRIPEFELGENEEIVEDPEQKSEEFDSSGAIDSVDIDLTENSFAQPVAAEVEVGPEQNSEDSDEVVDSVDIDITENSYAQPIEENGEVQKYNEWSKTELAELIEGHLLFGLVYYRANFSRWARLFTLTTIIIFELLLEGLLLYGFEDTETGSKESTETLFLEYEAQYFGYTILALAIAIPIEIFLIIALSIDRNKAPVWTAASIVLGVSIIIGSIIGIVMLSFSFCFEWSGYWAICFLFGILIQVFVFETFYMIARYFIISMVPRVEEAKSKA